MKVYLAGYESASTSYDLQLPDQYNVFLTYFYKKNASKYLTSKDAETRKGLITCDSGAHSFFGYMGTSVTHGTNSKGLSEMPDPHKYFDSYIEWLLQYSKNLDYFVELDLHELVGYQRVKEWRAELKRNNLWQKCIPTHRKYNSRKDFFELLDSLDSGYMALQGTDQDADIPIYTEFIKHCYARQIKVHGFALTKPRLMKAIPFYSVDSSRWLNPIKFGCFDMWDARKLELKTTKSTQKDFAKYKISPSVSSIVRTDQAVIEKLSLQAEQFYKMQKDITKVWEARGVFWKD